MATKLNLDLTPFLNFYSQADRDRFRHVDDYSFKSNFATTTKFKHSYSKRIVGIWNSLPLELRLAPTAFKIGVKKNRWGGDWGFMLIILMLYSLFICIFITLLDQLILIFFLLCCIPYHYLYFYVLHL